MPQHNHHQWHSRGPEAPGATGATDPVCGMTVTVAPDTRSETYAGETFQFCSEKCQKTFRADPWFYASGRAAERGEVVRPGTKYTCPMHPEILHDAPGT